MRYADGPTVEVDVVVDAPVERVWAIVSDIATPARFSEELLQVDWVDDERGEGARFVGRNRHPAIGEWETTSIVYRAEPGRAFAWHVSDVETPSASWWFELDDVAEGGVRVRHGGRLGPGWSGLTPAIEAMPEKEERIIERRLAQHAENMRRTLEGIKALAESPAAP